MQNKEDTALFYNFLGIAAKAGAVVYGAEGVQRGIQSKKIKLVLLDGGASENTRQAFRNACTHYKINLILLKETGKLGDSLGKPGKKVIGIKDVGFAQSVIKKYGVCSGGEELE